MYEQPPVDVRPKRRYLGLWVAVAVVVIGVTVGVVFGQTKEPPPVVDESLEAGLLVTSDFGSGFTVSKMTQDELNHRRAAPIPSGATVNPPECSELIRTGDQQDAAGKSVAISEATNASANTVYLQMIMRADEWPALDLRRADALLTACAEMKVSWTGRGTLTLYVSEVAGVEGEGYARSLTTGPEYGLGGFTLSNAMTKVGDHIVMFMGVGPVLDPVTFVRFANIANERVRAEL